MIATNCSSYNLEGSLIVERSRDLVRRLLSAVFGVEDPLARVHDTNLDGDYGVIDENETSNEQQFAHAVEDSGNLVLKVRLTTSKATENSNHSMSQLADEQKHSLNGQDGELLAIRYTRSKTAPRSSDSEEDEDDDDDGGEENSHSEDDSADLIPKKSKRLTRQTPSNTRSMHAAQNADSEDNGEAERVGVDPTVRRSSRARSSRSSALGDDYVEDVPAVAFRRTQPVISRQQQGRRTSRQQQLVVAEADAEEEEEEEEEVVTRSGRTRKPNKIYSEEEVASSTKRTHSGAVKPSVASDDDDVDQDVEDDGDMHQDRRRSGRARKVMKLTSHDGAADGRERADRVVGGRERVSRASSTLSRRSSEPPVASSSSTAAAPSSRGRASAAAVDRQVNSPLWRLFDLAQQSDELQIFAEPVPDDTPGYFDIITEPMDLCLIR